MTGRFTKETHRLTNETLPYYLLSNSNLNVKKYTITETLTQICTQVVLNFG